MPTTSPHPRTVAQTLRGAFLVVLAGVLLAGIAGTAGLALVVRAVEDVAQSEVSLLIANNEAMEAITDARSAKRGFALTGDETLLDDYERSRRRFHAALDEVFDVDDRPPLAASVEAQRRAGDDWFADGADPIIDLRRGPAATEADQAQLALADERFDTFRLASRATENAIRSRLVIGLRGTRTTAAVASAVLAVLVLVALLAGSRAAVHATRSVTGPLGRLVEVLTRLRGGELSARATASGPVEVAAVSDAINQLAATNERLTTSREAQIAVGRLIRGLAAAMHPLLDVAKVLEIAVTHLADFGDRAEARRLSLNDEPETFQRVWQGVAAPPADVDELPSRLLELIRESAGGRAALAIPDCRTDERLDAESRAFFEGQDARAVLVGAVRAGPDELVVIALYESTRVRVWTEPELALFNGTIREIATAVANSVAFAQQAQVLTRLEQLDRDKTDFLSNVSHELRTPLTSIIGYSELLGEGDAGELNEEQAGLLNTIARNSNRLLDLIEDLLLLSRIESGTFAMAVEPVDLAPVLCEVVDAVHPLYRARDVYLDVVVAAEDCVVEGDAHQLERVVLNLLTNAVKFTPTGGRVDVALDTDGGDALLTIRDSGIGIPEDEIDQLFERFYRASTSQANAIQGTGLGLAISKTIVDRHGGQIMVSSRLDVGSTFTVQLPLAADAGSTEGQASWQTLSTSSSS